MTTGTGPEPVVLTVLRVVMDLATVPQLLAIRIQADVLKLPPLEREGTSSTLQ